MIQECTHLSPLCISEPSLFADSAEEIRENRVKHRALHLAICFPYHTFFFLSCFWSIRLISQFQNHFTDGRTPWAGDQTSQGLYLNTGQNKHRININTHQISMPCVGFEPTIPASEQVKTVHAPDRSATLTGFPYHIHP
jgi:hypothetical protein